MKDLRPRRQELLELMADHILEQGLQAASLRPLAAAAGTSDRMLLYYFVDKDEMLTAVLGLLGGRIQLLLDRSLPYPKPYELLLPSICELMRSAAIKPYMQLWLELAALAARGREPYQTIARQLCDGFLAWTASRLSVSKEEDRSSLAALLFGTVEGLILLDAIGRGSTTEEALRARLKLTSGPSVGRRSQT